MDNQQYVAEVKKILLDRGRIASNGRHDDAQIGVVQTIEVAQATFTVYAWSNIVDTFELRVGKSGNIIISPFTSKITNERIVERFCDSISQYFSVHIKIEYPDKYDLLRESILTRREMWMLVRKMRDEKLETELNSLVEAEGHDVEKQSEYVAWVEKWLAKWESRKDLRSEQNT